MPKLSLPIFAILCFLSLILGASVKAQAPGVIGCDNESYPEYHSLRPYRARPCDKSISETVLSCGNDLIAVEKFEGITPGTPAEAKTCTSKGDGGQTCTFEFRNQTVSVRVELPDAELPILGNTQLVPNSESDADNLDPSQRTNDYVSWYLNGSSYRAEEEYPLTDKDEDITRFLNFAGPLRKLLPFNIQMKQRIKTISDANANDIRHNQVVGCIYGVEAFGITIGSVPAPCYQPSRSAVTEKRLTDWNGHLPPLEEDYKTFQDWWKAYQTWQGKLCIEVPKFIPVLGGKLISCDIDNPFNANFHANLFPYIPFSSTEDRIGDARADLTKTVQPTEDGVEITKISFAPSPLNPNQNLLYFAHTLEVNEVTDLLQKTYTPAGTNGYSGFKNPDELYNTDRCDFTQVRWNSGDDLFGERGTPITGTITYDTKFTCDFGPPTLDQGCYNECIDGGDSRRTCQAICTTSQACTKEVKTALSVYNGTPKGDELWDRLVAGSHSVVKRILPFDLTRQWNLLDLPGVTTARYTSSADETRAGVPSNKRSGERAEFYIPHLGGIDEYFLKGIQKALRPKDFGITFASGINLPPVSGECKAPPPGSSEISSIIDSARGRNEAAAKVPKGLLEAIYQIEGFVYYNRPGYDCTYNDAGALGLMQVTDPAYNWAAPPTQRLQDQRMCAEIPGKLSRCYSVDTMEIAARVLLFKVGKWDSTTFQVTGEISSKEDIYNAAWRYYGKKEPDEKTQNFAKGNIRKDLWKNGSYLNMGYGDLVCALMGLCPTYP